MKEIIENKTFDTFKGIKYLCGNQLFTLQPDEVYIGLASLWTTVLKIFLIVVVVYLETVIGLYWNNSFNLLWQIIYVKEILLILKFAGC